MLNGKDIGNLWCGRFRTGNAQTKRWDAFVFAEVNAKEGDCVNGIEVCDENRLREKFGVDLEAVIGVGEPAIRERLYQKIRAEGFAMPALIHPSVCIPENTVIGEGVVIQVGCFVSCNVQIGNIVYIHPHTNIGHDCILEEGCVVAGFSNIAGTVHIGEYSYLALSCVIKQGLVIGKNSIIGMGAVVFRNVEDSMIVLGNPAKVIGRNDRRKVF